jgi:hypothetical protein
LSVDEEMMSFKGKMKNMIYNLTKPDKWGMTFYVLEESKSGYALSLEKICIGKNCH